MTTIYFLRHQAAGVLWQYPFAEPPTEAQKAAVARECFQTHGAAHQKTGEEYWLKLVEQPVFGPQDVPQVPERSLAVAGAPRAAVDASAPQTVASGVATVVNPKT